MAVSASKVFQSLREKLTTFSKIATTSHSTSFSANQFNLRRSKGMVMQYLVSLYISINSQRYDRILRSSSGGLRPPPPTTTLRLCQKSKLQPEKQTRKINPLISTSTIHSTTSLGSIPGEVFIPVLRPIFNDLFGSLFCMRSKPLKTIIVFRGLDRYSFLQTSKKKKTSEHHV